MSKSHIAVEKARACLRDYFMWDLHRLKAIGTTNTHQSGDRHSENRDAKTKKYVVTNLGIVILFALLTLAFFAPTLFATEVQLPIGSDFVNFNYPNDLFAARSLKQGEIPLWNPYIAAGQPFAADPNIGFFYPLRLLLFLTTFNYRTMTYLVIFHYFLAGTFAYALARDLGAGRWGSIVAGVGFMFSGLLVGQMDHINIVISSSWMPLVFLLFRRSVLRKKLTYAMVAGLSLSLSVLGGHQQFALLIGYWCSLWLVMFLIQARGRGFLPSVTLYSCMIFVALGAAAVQILPTIEFFQLTQRAVLSVNEAGLYSMPPLGWLLLIFPHYLGQTHTEAAFFWEFLVFVNEFYAYVGIVVLFGALIGSYVWKSWEKRFLVAMLILGFLLTAGSATPIYTLAYEMVPGMQWVRVPSRFVFWVDTSLVLLSAFGVDWMVSNLHDRSQRIWREMIQLLGLGSLVGLAFGLLYLVLPVLQVPTSHPFATEINRYRLADALVLAGIMAGLMLAIKLTNHRPRLRNWLPILLLVFLLFDLFRAQQPRHFTTTDMTIHFEHPEILQAWRNDPGFFRVDFTNEAYRGSTYEFTQESRWNVLTGFVHSFAQVTGLPWNPFDLQRFSDYRDVVSLDSPFYDFLSAKYLVSDRGEVLSDKWVKLPVAANTLNLYENSQSMPRAFMVFEALVEPDPEKALTLIREAAFDPATTVLLEKGEPFAGPVGSAHIEIVNMTNNTLALTVQNDQPGYLVISDTDYPGWRVTVNGKQAEIMLANYAFRAVYLRAGRSTVLFEFQSMSVARGMVITLTTWLVIGLGMPIAYWCARNLRPLQGYKHIWS